MRQQPVPPWALRSMATVALVLLIGLCTLWAVSEVLGGMGDVAGRRVLRYVALAGGVLLAVDLICLVLAQGFNASGQKDDREQGG